MIENKSTLINLIQKSREGDLDAFEEIYKTHKNYVYTIILDFFNDHTPDFEDLMQEIFLKAYTHLKELKNEDSFVNWLAGISLNVCREHFRKKGFLKNKGILVPIENYDIEADEKEGPSQVVESHHTQKIMINVINKLPSIQRLSMTLFYFNDFSYKEISKALDITENSVRMALYKGRNNIKEELTKKLGVQETATGIYYNLIFLGYGKTLLPEHALPTPSLDPTWINIKEAIPSSKMPRPKPIKAYLALISICLILSGFTLFLLPDAIPSAHQMADKTTPFEKITILKESLPKESLPASMNVADTHEKGPEITNTALVNGQPTNTVATHFESDASSNHGEPSENNLMTSLPKTGGASLLLLAFLLIGFGLIIQEKIEKRRKKVKIKKLFKKIGLWTSILAIMASIVTGSFSTPTKAEGIPGTSVDYSSQAEILDWNLLDANGNPLSETNPAIHYLTYQLWVKCAIIPENGAVFHEGDTFTLPLPSNGDKGGWIITPSSFENFTDSNGVVLGQWRISDTAIEAVLGSNVEGSSFIEANFTTGKNALRNGTTSSITQNVTLGNISKSINFKKANLTPLDSRDRKTVDATSNSIIKWTTYINNLGVCELAKKEWGTQFTEQKNVYFEDKLNGTLDGSVNILSTLSLPVDLENGIASNDYAETNITSRFTEVTQNPTESYGDFKARLNPLEYGVFTDSNQSQTIVVYFGDIGNNGMTYESIDPNFIENTASATINAGFYDEAARAELENFYTQAFGNNNVINGNVARYLVSFKETYNTVLNDTPKTNTAVITKNGIPNQVSGTGILQGNMGAASVVKNTASVFLYDEDTGALLPNATFKLQYKNGSHWEDYEPVGILTTDANGAAVTPALGLGTYRFVEITPCNNEYDLAKSNGYDSSLGTVISQEFTIANTDVDGHKIPVSNIKGKYTVTYTKGDHGTFEDNTFSDILRNTPTPSYSGLRSTDNEPIGEPGYHFTGWDKTISINVTQDELYTAQWEPNDYPITYVLDGGTNDPTNPTNYTYGVGVNSFENPVKKGYTFLGWYPSETDETILTSILPTDQGEKTLYARWEKNTDIFTNKKTVDIPQDKTVKTGDIMTYTIKTENSGNKDSDRITISDSIPEGTTYVEGSATEGAIFDGTKLTLTKDSLAPGETLTLTFKVKVKEGVKTGDTITNVAKVNDQDTNRVETPTENPDIVVPATNTTLTSATEKNTPVSSLPKTGGYILIGLGLLIGLTGLGLLIKLNHKSRRIH